MVSTTTNPSIDQAALLEFQRNFFELAQQTESYLANSNSVMYLPSMGKTHNMARIGRQELTEVDVRNPDKQFSDYSLDNRQFTKRRFTTTVQIDAKFDINELIADPTSSIVTQLNNAKERVIDRVIVEAALGPVLVGQPDATPTSRTAAQDGVITVDATSGLTYEKIQEITQNFINNELPLGQLRGTVLNITGKENTNLMSEIEFISSDYISSRPVEAGYQNNAGMYEVNLFAGSSTGTGTFTNAILPEVSTTRNCVVMSPDAIAVAMELGRLDVEKSNTKVNSYDITIDLWINAMRTEGVRVQQVNTTI